jgi:hypothetical protein
MIGQLSHGVDGVGGFPYGLFGSEAFDGDRNRCVPVFLVPGVAELFEEDRAKIHFLFFLRLLSGGCWGDQATADAQEGDDSNGDEVFSHNSRFFSNIGILRDRILSKSFPHRPSKFLSGQFAKKLQISL